MSKTEIHINDSYKNHPEIEAPKERFQIFIELTFMDSLILKLSILFDANAKNMRIVEIKSLNLEKELGSNADINVNTNSTVHDGKHAVRFTINFSYKTILKNEVGSSIFKLTNGGIVVPYSKTENVSEIKIVGGDG